MQIMLKLSASMKSQYSLWYCSVQLVGVYMHIKVNVAMVLRAELQEEVLFFCCNVLGFLPLFLYPVYQNVNE